MMKFAIRLPFFVLLFTISSAFAQYVWIDEKGHKQYSDQAPPANIPQDKILKSLEKKVDDVKPAPSIVKEKPPESLADKEVTYKKRREDLAAKEKKDAEEAKEAAAKSDYCKKLQSYKQTLDSGQRISQVDAAGVQGYMSDEKRAAEVNELRQKLGECNN